jgi:hypothetical protein
VSFASLARFSADLRRLPRALAQQVTEEAAPVITDLARKTFEASENAYGVPWRPGADGGKVTLRQSGNLARQIRYVAIGTKIRVALGVRYAKYQIGRRPVFPTQGAALPREYARALSRIAVNAIRAALKGAP